MRVTSCMIALVFLCTTFTGCSLFKKNTNDAQGPKAPSGGAAPAKFPNDPLLNSNIGTPPPAFPAAPAAQTSATTGNSILAGTIVDAYHRPVGNAYIRWVSVGEKDAGTPADVAADAGGHFIIQGVQPGAKYKLIARTKYGEKMYAGTTLTYAPNVRVMISIREDLANSDTPPLPGTPAVQGEADKKNTSWNQGIKSGQEPNLPATLNVTTPSLNTPVGNPPNSVGVPSFVPGVVENPKDRMPMLQIPGTGAPPSIPNGPPPLPALPPAAGAKLDTGPTRVPSCVLVGSHLENLALKDCKGQTWEYKKSGYGKLVLLDFWGTYCPPCRATMPDLNRLHQQYHSRGLEVIGIAIEAGKDEKREAEAVNKLCTSMGLSYRQLMGRVGTVDVGKQFRVEGLPTMMLLSEQGDIIWHHVGRPDPALLSALERTIQSRLSGKAF